MEGAVMAWYEIINAQSDSFLADRDAEDLLRQLAMAVQTEDGPVEAEGCFMVLPRMARAAITFRCRRRPLNARNGY
jgi:hypothetical protein